MTTPLDIITLALKDSGVVGIGQTPLAQDTNDTFVRLNYMIAQWQRKRWLIWHLIDLAFTSTGAQSYTIGAGGNFNVAQRPDKIEGAYFKQLINTGSLKVDYPLEIIEAKEDYNKITLKSLTTFPQYLFYDSAYPTGLIYPWPVIQSGTYELHITIKDLLNQFTTLTQTISLPLEYFAALHYNLACRLRIAYRLPVDIGLVALAKDALNVIRNANAQIPTLKMPTGLLRGGIYNIYSDQNY